MRYRMASCACGPCYCAPVHGPVWSVKSREEVAEDLEDYKRHLELEIRELERKIRRLKEKAAE